MTDNALSLVRLCGKKKKPSSANDPKAASTVPPPNPALAEFLARRPPPSLPKSTISRSRTPPGISPTSTPRTLEGPPVPAPPSKGKGKEKGKLSYRDATLQSKGQAKGQAKGKNKGKNPIGKGPKGPIGYTFPTRRALLGHKGPPLLSFSLILTPTSLVYTYSPWRLPATKTRYSWLALPSLTTTFTLSTSVALSPGSPGHKDPPLLAIATNMTATVLSNAALREKNTSSHRCRPLQQPSHSQSLLTYLHSLYHQSLIQVCPAIKARHS